MSISGHFVQRPVATSLLMAAIFAVGAAAYPFLPLAALPTVVSAKVHIVWDPIWTPQLISPEGRKVLGLE